MGRLDDVDEENCTLRVTLFPTSPIQEQDEPMPDGSLAFPLLEHSTAISKYTTDPTTTHNY
jgi:hypothetical protein